MAAAPIGSPRCVPLPPPDSKISRVPHFFISFNLPEFRFFEFRISKYRMSEIILYNLQFPNFPIRISDAQTSIINAPNVQRLGFRILDSRMPTFRTPTVDFHVLDFSTFLNQDFPNFQFTNFEIRIYDICFPVFYSSVSELSNSEFQVSNVRNYYAPLPTFEF